MALFVLLIASQAFGQVPSLGRCPETSVVQNFNVPLYLGRWFEIRSYPAAFQLGLSCVEANYSLNPNGTVAVLNSGVRLGRTTSSLGVAELVEEGQGKLIVNFPESPSKSSQNFIFLSNRLMPQTQPQRLTTSYLELTTQTSLLYIRVLKFRV